MPKIFREVSLERIASNEGLDQMLQVTTPRKWMAVAVAVLGFCCLVAWGFWGEMTTEVQGQGIVMLGPMKEIRAEHGGQVRRVAVARDQWVRRGELLLEWLDDAGVSHTLNATEDGKIAAVYVDDGNRVRRDQPLLVISQGQPGETRNALVFLPPALASRVSSGMPVRLQPLHVPPQRYGQLKGAVSVVEALPLGTDDLRHHLGFDGLVQVFQQNEPLVAVHVALPRVETTASGLTWTTKDGPPQAIAEGTLCTAFVQVGKQRPISLLFPETGSRGSVP